MPCRLDVVIRLDVTTLRAPAVRGRLESLYGDGSFSGWLDLLGQLEGLVDRAHADAAQAQTTDSDCESNEP